MSVFAVPAAAEPVAQAMNASQSGARISDEFFISCTQDYERGSQAVASPELLPCASQVRQTHYAPSATAGKREVLSCGTDVCTACTAATKVPFACTPGAELPFPVPSQHHRGVWLLCFIGRHAAVYPDAAAPHRRRGAAKHAARH
eukprot:350874-Chlamydomonas_euryale.AAC.8